MDDRSPETSYYSSARPSGATGSEAADNQKKSKTLPFALGVVQSGDYASQSEPNSPTHSHYLNSPGTSDWRNRISNHSENFFFN